MLFLTLIKPKHSCMRIRPAHQVDLIQPLTARRASRRRTSSTRTVVGETAASGAARKLSWHLHRASKATALPAAIASCRLWPLASQLSPIFSSGAPERPQLRHHVASAVLSNALPFKPMQLPPPMDPAAQRRRQVSEPCLPLQRTNKPPISDRANEQTNQRKV